MNLSDGNYDNRKYSWHGANQLEIIKNRKCWLKRSHLGPNSRLSGRSHMRKPHEPPQGGGMRFTPWAEDRMKSSQESQMPRWITKGVNQLKGRETVVFIYDKMLHHNQPLTLVEAATEKGNPHTRHTALCMLHAGCCMLHAVCCMLQEAHTARAACNTSPGRFRTQGQWEWAGRG